MALSSIEQVRNKISWPGIVNNSSCAKQYSNKEEYDADTITNKDCSNVENFLQGRLNSDFIQNELLFNVSDENNILFKKALIPFLKPDDVTKLSLVSSESETLGTGDMVISEGIPGTSSLDHEIPVTGS